MDLLFKHYQEKVEKSNNNKSSCDLKVFSDETTLIYDATFELGYSRYGSRINITFQHTLNVSILNGDINVSYKIINENLSNEKTFRNKTITKKNNFGLLVDLTENGFLRGEKRIGYWGVKYNRALDSIVNIFIDKIKPSFKSTFYLDKDYNQKYSINRLYDLLVDFHLNMKGIKSHDGIYNDIRTEYPKKKWLVKNDYKFLPAVLDSYGIKSKYLISELNKKCDKPIHISSLNYICKLFGENYIDYLKQFVWDYHCFELPVNKKTHELKNESEKQFMVKTIQNWEKDTLRPDSLIYSLNKLFSIRDLLEPRGLELKFKAKNDIDFENHIETWSGIKLHFARGYKVKYNIPNDVVDVIQEDIIIGYEVFKPKVLLTEEDYRLEGFYMKNCMAKQFPHGLFYIYISLSNKRKKIDLQYRKGRLIQSYGKANTPVSNELFGQSIEILSKRIEKFSDLEWKKEKYDFITNSL
jgi:hypothetical protein